MRTVQKLAVDPDPCPVCARPNFYPSDHHMVPKSRGGRATETICRDCHKAVHALFSNKDLEKTYHTVDALLGNEAFAKMVKFIAKQDPTRKQAFKRSKDSQRRGHAG